MGTDLYLVAALASTNPRKRNSLMAVMRRARKRTMQKWRMFIIFVINLYFWWKGGGVTVTDERGQQFKIDDASLSDSLRLRAMATQATVNSDYERSYRLLLTVVDYIFDTLGDQTELELFEGDLFSAMDFSDAPSRERMAELEKSWDGKYVNGGNPSRLPIASPGTGAIRVPDKPGGSY